MRNPTGKKLEKIIFKLFDDASQGVDRYNHNGSLWAIFTNEMRWVVEFTKDQTLWYNYNFFKDEMELIGLDCIENKDLIQKWFESRFLNINSVEDTIQNGVKHTLDIEHGNHLKVEDTIQNGVKNTYSDKIPHEYDWSDEFTEEIEDTIQNGIKDTKSMCGKRGGRVGNTIQNGVKLTKSTIMSQDSKIENTIQNGVKETIGTLRRTAKWGVDDIIQNGVKETHDDCSNNIARVEGIVRIGEKLN